MRSNDGMATAVVIAGCFLVSTILSGCSTVTKTDYIKHELTVPQHMFQCEEATERPSGEVIMESETARYIASLEYSNKDCKQRLRDLKAVIDCDNNPKCDPDTLSAVLSLVREGKSR